MNIITTLSKILVALLAIFLVGGMLLPSSFTTVVRVQTQAEAAPMCQIVATPRTWVDWSAWNLKMMPDMKSTYSGPETGEGAIWSWTQAQGNGSLTIITHRTPPNPCVVAFELLFEGNEEPWYGQIHVTPMDDGTQVDWAFHGDVGSNLLFRWVMLVMKDRMADENRAAIAGLEAAALAP
jgi:hypothetical protein